MPYLYVQEDERREAAGHMFTDFTNHILTSLCCIINIEADAHFCFKTLFKGVSPNDLFPAKRRNVRTATRRQTGGTAKVPTEAEGVKWMHLAKANANVASA